MSVERPTLAKFTKYLMKAGEELGYRIRDPNAFGPYEDGEHIKKDKISAYQG
jgi:hypothetical protein